MRRMVAWSILALAAVGAVWIGAGYLLLIIAGSLAIGWAVGTLIDL